MLQAPGLAVVLVGNRGDSETYVRSKKKACEEVGIKSFGTDLPEDVSQEELLKVRPLLHASLATPHQICTRMINRVSSLYVLIQSRHTILMMEAVVLRLLQRGLAIHRSSSRT